MPYISKTTIDKINNTPLKKALEAVCPTLELKRAGSIYKGLSPFNSERTGSFTVSETKGIWKDFSSNNGGTSAIDFLIKKDNLAFPEAAERCARALGIDIEYENDTPAAREKREEMKSLADILRATNRCYRQYFTTLPDDHPAKAYIASRHFTPEIIEAFAIGYALPGGLYEKIKNAGKVTEATTLGILKEAQGGTHYEAMRSRLIFPIHDKRGNPVGFGARTLPDPQGNTPKNTAKYINSPDSDLFHKGRLLYGLHLAAKAIHERGEAYLCEGYTDVMRMHQIGLTNTVATLGTALTPEHLKTLGENCKRIVLFRDADPAGLAAAWRDLDLLLQAGFFVDIITPEVSNQSTESPKEDPDTLGQRPDAIAYITAHRTDALLYKLECFIEEAKTRIPDFLEYEDFESLMPQDAQAFHKLVSELLSKIADPVVRSSYQKLIAKKFHYSFQLSAPSSQPSTPIATTDPTPQTSYPIQTGEEREQNGNKTGEESTEVPTPITPSQYMLDDLLERYKGFPQEVEDNLAAYYDDITRYGCFQHRNIIYCLEDKGKTFEPISNFSIAIIQHMNDEATPMKLIRIRNVFGFENVFDTLSERINTLQGFVNLVTSFGNYTFEGSSKQLNKLLKLLFNKMGTGRKIDVLGIQPEGFWVWNNLVITADGKEETISEDGLYTHKGISYYIPSANHTYKNNNTKYMPQKRFRSIPTTITLTEYFHQVYTVHRAHAITGILFGVAALFNDIVYNKVKGFPILFYYGPASTGKDNICQAIMSLFGIPQNAINLGGNTSTAKAKVRELAQFRNGLSQFSEYTRGNAQLDEMLKGVWDRDGYKRGNLESKVAVEEIPIESAVILTSNQCPNVEPLITRFIWNEMQEQTFSPEAVEAFNRLKATIARGVSSLSNYFLTQRTRIRAEFSDAYNAAERTLTAFEVFKDCPARIKANPAILLAFFDLFTHAGIYPFERATVVEHLCRIAARQKAKIAADAPDNKFWDCFLACMKLTTGEPIRTGINYREVGGLLYFNFTNIYSIIQRQWFTQYREPAPTKAEMRKYLKEAPAYTSDVSAYRINPATNGTSAMSFDIAKINIAEELREAIQLQQNNNNQPTDDDENTLF